MTFAPLQPVSTASATNIAEILANIYVSSRRPHPKLHQLPEFQKPKGGLPIALAAGGPSLAQNVHMLRTHGAVSYPIIAVGSAHDYLVEQGVKPDYAVVCDPDPVITALYLKQPLVSTNYLIASQCAESVFEALKDKPITLWHCVAEDQKLFLDALEPGWQGVGGGCTAGLRALSIALILGYSNIHFYGFDSCVHSAEAHHAYGFQTKDEELGPLYEIKVKSEGEDMPEEVFTCAGYQLAQAQHFEQFFAVHLDKFQATFHGGGLMKAVYDKMMAQKGKTNG